MEYIDTSVLVAFYWPESYSPAAQEAIQTARPPVISPLCEVEMHSALALKTRRKEMDASTARRVLSAFRAHRAAGIYRLVAVEPRDFDLACSVIAEFRSPLRAPDALHLAVASSNDLRLVTADKGLAGSADRFGVRYKRIG